MDKFSTSGAGIPVHFRLEAFQPELDEFSSIKIRARHKSILADVRSKQLLYVLGVNPGRRYDSPWIPRAAVREDLSVPRRHGIPTTTRFGLMFFLCMPSGLL